MYISGFVQAASHSLLEKEVGASKSHVRQELVELVHDSTLGRGQNGGHSKPNRF